MAAKSKSTKTERNHTGTGVHAGDRMAEVTETARKNYEHAVRTGQKLQDQAGQWWTRILSQGPGLGDWQKHFAGLTRLTTDTLPLAQRRMEDMMSWMECSSRNHAELMRKAMDAAQTPSVAESQNKWMDVWASSMKALQAQVESATEVSTQAIDGWIQFIRKNTEVVEVRTPKTA